MKNVIKKIAAVAMAFTLLGTGTTIAKTVNPKSMTTLSAHAACNHVVQRKYLENWQDRGQTDLNVFYDIRWWSRRYEDRCCKCNKLIKSGTYYRYFKINVFLGTCSDLTYDYTCPLFEKK